MPPSHGTADNVPDQHDETDFDILDTQSVLEKFMSKLSKQTDNEYLSLPVLLDSLPDPSSSNTAKSMTAAAAREKGVIPEAVTHSIWNAIDFGEEMSRYVHIRGICYVYNMYMSVISFEYTWTNQILHTAGLFGNYPSSSILHWRA